ncbi:polyprenyl synthetase family protein [Nocardia sp. ET3-3]|uniref:Polyprenyl synthetase family protein n=1 Tax=Nocardia terrae TaxID=2675851 RepID=A0A7K1V2M2_9NOCA|nr:polyprenyl synthetase family protein [Nocardia terrae]MVU80893.1 polyprenyl synthetase family protein [Nocardia terrae]
MTNPAGRPPVAPSAAELLAGARAAVVPVMREAVDALPEPMRRMAGYHLGWWNTEGGPETGAAGKMLRPALVLAAAAACGDATHAAAPGAAVELIHNFTLLHDDVIDGDRLRRGRETVWSRWGVPAAITLGDAMHACAVAQLVSRLPAQLAIGAAVRVEATVIDISVGQHQDCDFERRTGVDVAEYAAMAVAKTGSLFGTSCALGALAARADPTTVAAMDTFGRELGIACQLADDLLGIWGDPAITGKPVGNDLARRKQSMPVVAAMSSKTAAGQELSALYRRGRPLTAADVERATRLIEATGARTEVLRIADDRVSAALAALPDRAAAGDLLVLVDAIVHRDR